MTARDQVIAIAGGGIGGLATALALAQRGLNAHIFERREACAEDGAGIQIGPNGARILTALGLENDLRKFNAVPDGLSVRCGVTGRPLTRLPLGTWIKTRHGAPYWTVHRQDLHTALMAAAERDPLITINLNTEVQSFENRDDRVDVQVAGAAPISAAALIAADGLWSRLRSQIGVASPFTPAGKCAYRTVIQQSSLPADLAANDVHIWLSPGAHVVHYPVRAGREVALIVIVDAKSQRESWSSPAPDDWHSSKGLAFPQPLQTLLQAASAWRMWPLQILQPLETWTNGRVALLGDAAHPVLPFLAQGGVLALEDAQVLANALAKSDQSIPDRLLSYEHARQQRALRVAKVSQRNGKIYHLSDAMAVARNAVLAAAPPERLIANYDWLYGWKA